MPYVFCYGGNTNPNQLSKQYPSHKVVGKGTLDEFQLRCCKYTIVSDFISQVTRLECSYCNVERCKQKEVVGIVVDLSDEDLKKMDIQECRGHIYERYEREVLVDNNPIQCWVYEMISPGETHTPSERYLRVVEIGYTHFGLPKGQLHITA